MDNTQEIESPEVFNKDLLAAIAGSDDGQLKAASAAASKMDGFADREFNSGDQLMVFFSNITMLGWIILDQVLRATMLVLV